MTYNKHTTTSLFLLQFLSTMKTSSSFLLSNTAPPILTRTFHQHYRNNEPIPSIGVTTSHNYPQTKLYGVSQVSKASTKTTTIPPKLIGIDSITGDLSEEWRTEGSVLNPLVVCGPSGVGKGTIISKYMNELNGSQHFGFTVSHTTRQPRPGEINGIHYHFTPYSQMKDAIALGDFLEYAEVHGNLYGTSFASMQDVQFQQHKICLLDIDTQGVRNLKHREYSHQTPEIRAKFVFVAPPSMEILNERLVGRGTESEEDLKKRTESARMEVEYGLTEGNFDVVIVNDDIEKACEEFGRAVKELYPELR